MKKKYIYQFILCFVIFCLVNIFRHDPVDVIVNLILSVVVIAFQMFRDRNNARWENKEKK